MHLPIESGSGVPRVRVRDVLMVWQGGMGRRRMLLPGYNYRGGRRAPAWAVLLTFFVFIFILPYFCQNLSTCFFNETE